MKAISQTELIDYVSSAFIFILIFSFFNDNFTVRYFGENSLKAIFILFFVFYGSTIIKNFKGMTLFQDKMFFLFSVSLVVVFAIENLFDMTDKLFENIMLLAALFSIIIYFSRYPLTKLLYFIWLSMMLSVLMAYFNPPMTEWTFRTSGGTDDPNEFAAQLLAFLFVSIYLYNKNKNKIFITVSIVFFTYAIFVAGSKSAFLMLAIVAILTIIKYLFFDIKKILNYKFFLFLLVILIISLQIDYSKIKAVQNMQERAKNSHTFDTRLAAWNGGYHMVVAHPFLGVGMGDFVKYTREYATVYVSASAPHNLFVKLIAESGIPVFILYILFLITLFFQNYKTAYKSSIFWIYMSFLSLLFMGMSIGITYDKYFLVFMAVMLNTNYTIRKGITP